MSIIYTWSQWSWMLLMLFGTPPLFNSLSSKAFTASVMTFPFYPLLSVLLPSVQLSLRWLNHTLSLSWQRELNGVSIRFCTLLIQLPHGLCTTFPHSSCDVTLVTSWPWYVTFVIWHLPTLLPCSKSKWEEKRKRKRKRKINNNLAVLPSHDTPLFGPKIHPSKSCYQHHYILYKGEVFWPDQELWLSIIQRWSFWIALLK